MFHAVAIPEHKKKRQALLTLPVPENLALPRTFPYPTRSGSGEFNPRSLPTMAVIMAAMAVIMPTMIMVPMVPDPMTILPVLPVASPIELALDVMGRRSIHYRGSVADGAVMVRICRTSNHRQADTDTHTRKWQVQAESRQIDGQAGMGCRGHRP